MFESVTVIGAGRAGSAIAARLRERGVAVRDGRRARLLCVPDSRDRRGRARRSSRGRGSRTSPARRRSPRSTPHARRFSVHPLQTLVRSRGPEQLDGAWAAVTAESDEAHERALWLAETLGLRPFDAGRRRARALPRGRRRSRRTSSSRSTAPRRGSLADAGAPPEALVPLMRRTIENDFELTGPIARGDWETIERHLAAIREREPQLEPLYAALAEATRAVKVVARSPIGELELPRARRGRARADDGRAPRRPRRAVRAARPRLRHARREPLRQPGAVLATPADLDRVPARPRRATPRLAEAEGVDVLFAPTPTRCTRPGSRPGSMPEGAARRARGRRTAPATSAASRPSCLKLFNIVRPQLAWFGRKDAQQVAVLKQLVRDLNLDVEIRVVDTVRDADGLALSSRNARLSPTEREQALAIPRALATARRRARARASSPTPASTPDYVEVADLDGPTLAVAARVGDTRLIDNVLLEGDRHEHTPPHSPHPRPRLPASCRCPSSPR